MSPKRKKKRKKRRTQQEIRRTPAKRQRPAPQEGVHLEVSQYEITSEPIIDREYRRLPSKVRDRIEELCDLVMRNPREAIPHLEELIERYPQVPRLYNYLAVAYAGIGDSEKAEAIVLESYERHPEYLFAKCNYADICLLRGDIEEIPAIFDNKFDLKMLYPRRKRFHVTEVVGFMGVVGRYFCAIGEEQAARVHYDVLRQIAPRHPHTKRLKKVLHPPLIERVLRKMMKYGEAET